MNRALLPLSHRPSVARPSRPCWERLIEKLSAHLRPHRWRAARTGETPVPPDAIATRRFCVVCIWAALLAMAGGTIAGPRDDVALPTTTEASSRFAFVDAFVDSKDQPLAAYQFELSARGPGVTLVGVEGGDAPAFAEPPYYDPKANLQNRIIIAAFNTGANLPHGRTRVARVMVRLTGNRTTAWSAKLDVAASADAKPINADIQVSQGETP